MQEGWICPRCKKSLAPWVKECNCIEKDPKYDPNIPDYYHRHTPQTGDPLPPPGYTVC